MLRLASLALVVAACGTTDDRPKTLEYLTEAILAPTCAAVQCHSSFRQQVGDVFDTVRATRKSLYDNGLVALPPSGKASETSLIIAVTVGLPSILSPGAGNVRMPYDAPMPNEDVALLQAWIQMGAPGAQCVPEEGNRCVGNDVRECTADGNLGRTIQTCTAPQSCIGGTVGAPTPGACQ